MELTDIEQSKKLEEWGAPQDTEKVWWGNTDGNGHPSSPIKLKDGYILKDNERKIHAFGEVYAAYDLESLIVWLVNVKRIKNFEISHGVISTHEVGDEFGWYADCSDCIETEYGYSPLEAVYSLCESLHKK